jgi:hypothetical protein
MTDRERWLVRIHCGRFSVASVLLATGDEDIIGSKTGCRVVVVYNNSWGFRLWEGSRRCE